jgi:hypothetical protein
MASEQPRLPLVNGEEQDSSVARNDQVRENSMDITPIGDSGKTRLSELLAQ